MVDDPETVLTTERRHMIPNSVTPITTLAAEYKSNIARYNRAWGNPTEPADRHRLPRSMLTDAGPPSIERDVSAELSQENPDGDDDDDDNDDQADSLPSFTDVHLPAIANDAHVSDVKGYDTYHYDKFMKMMAEHNILAQLSPDHVPDDDDDDDDSHDDNTHVADDYTVPIEPPIAATDYSTYHYDKFMRMMAKLNADRASTLAQSSPDDVPDNVDDDDNDSSLAPLSNDMPHGPDAQDGPLDKPFDKKITDRLTKLTGLSVFDQSFSDLYATTRHWFNHKPSTSQARTKAEYDVDYMPRIMGRHAIPYSKARDIMIDHFTKDHTSSTTTQDWSFIGRVVDVFDPRVALWQAQSRAAEAGFLQLAPDILELMNPTSSKAEGAASILSLCFTLTALEADLVRTKRHGRCMPDQPSESAMWTNINQYLSRPSSGISSYVPTAIAAVARPIVAATNRVANMVSNIGTESVNAARTARDIVSDCALTVAENFAKSIKTDRIDEIVSDRSIEVDLQHMGMESICNFQKTQMVEKSAMVAKTLDQLRMLANDTTVKESSNAKIAKKIRKLEQLMALLDKVYPVDDSVLVL